MFDLYVITDPGTPFGLVAQTTAALRAATPGRVAVQVRAKDYPTRALLALSRALREATRRAGAPLLINDRVDVALVVEADGVHLTETSMSAADARSLLGENALVGVSCHDRAGVERAARDGASFVTVAPVFPTPAKGSPLCLDGLRVLCAATSLPVIAVGGIDPSNAAATLQAGAWGVGVIRAVYSVRDACSATRQLLATLDSARGPVAQSH